MRYVAFLRGINVGGKAKVSMADLKVIFESLGFTEIKTLLNSGNIIFTSSTREELGGKIEDSLKKKYSWRIPVLIRTFDEINHLIKADPFKGVNITSDTRLYVTFFVKANAIKINELSQPKDVEVKQLSEDEICCAIRLSPQKNTTDMMKWLEKTFGREVTTRNWNTIVKIADL